jgi:Flp pilus assembly protein TadG
MSEGIGEMRRIVKHYFLRCRSFGRRTQGVAAVEFAILGTVLIFVLGGIIDFGHSFYISQVVTNASREGARYGVTFQVDSTATRIPPSSLSPSISNYVTTKYIAPTLVASLSPSVAVAGAGYGTGAKGQPVLVTVSATKNWFLLGTIIPGLPTTIAATSVMQCE